jgi:hypothetical protein
MTFGFVSPKKYRQRARTLRNIRIDEVSSVDRGAGQGVRVKLLKRDATPSATAVKEWNGIGGPIDTDRGYRFIEKKEDSQMSQLELINKALNARAAGTLSDYDLGRMHQAWAVEAFPAERSIGAALQKWYGTVAGQQALNSAQHMYAHELQKRHACGDGFEAVMKMNKERAGGGIPHVHHAQASAPVGSDDGDNDTDDSDAAMKELLHMAAEHKKANPKMSDAQCFEHVRQASPRGRALFEAQKTHDVMKNLR